MKVYSIKKQHTMTQTSDCDASMHLNIDMKHMRDVDTDMHIPIHDAGIGLVRRHAMTETPWPRTDARQGAQWSVVTPAPAGRRQPRISARQFVATASKP